MKGMQMTSQGLVGDPRAEAHRFVGARSGDVQRQHGFVGVAGGFQTGEFGKALRRRPRCLHRGDVLRRPEVGHRRRPRVAGAAPVDFPAGVKLELETQPQRPVADRGYGGHQPRLTHIGPRPVACPARRFRRARRQSETRRRGHRPRYRKTHIHAPQHSARRSRRAVTIPRPPSPARLSVQNFIFKLSPPPKSRLPLRPAA